MARRQLASQLISLAILIALARLYTYNEPVEMDAATYAVVAHEMRDGRYLYSDLWDHKPPAVHATFALAQTVFGYGPGHVYALGVVVAVLTMIGVFAAASAPPFGAEVGLWAAAFWALISGDLYLQANQPNTEVFQNLFLVWAFALLLRMPNHGSRLGRAAAIGVLFALASLYKHVAVVTAMMLTGVSVLSLLRDGVAPRRVLSQAAVIAAVVAASWAAVAAYFALTERLADFYGAVFLFNRQYAGNSGLNILLGLSPGWLLPPCMHSMLPLIVLTMVGATAGWQRGAQRFNLLAAYAVGTIVSVALPGRFFEHYYQLWLPVLAIGGAWGLAVLWPSPAESPRWFARAGLGVALVLLAVQLPYYRLAPQEWSMAKFGGRLVNSRTVATLINQILLPDETFYEWGHEAELYFYSGRRAPGSEFRSEHLLAGPRGEERSEKLVTDLVSAEPELLLISGQFRFPLDHPVPQWLMQHYAEFPPQISGPWHQHGYRAFYRCGGRLERRVLEQQRQTASGLPSKPANST